MTFDMARVQAMADELDAKMARLEQFSAAAAKTGGSTDLSEKDLAEIEKAAKAPGAPAALKDLQRKVDSGQLSWRDIAAGKALGDEDFQRAMRLGMPSMKKAYHALQEGQNIDEIIAAGQVRRRPRGDFDDDEPSQVTEDAF